MAINVSVNDSRAFQSDQPKVVVRAIATRHNQARAEWARRLDICRELLIEGADVNDEGFGMQPLTMAVSIGYREMVELLLEFGADIQGGRKFSTPLLRAAATPELYALLLSYGAVETAFTDAAVGDLKRLARRLKKAPELIKCADEDGLTLLHHAATHLKDEVVTFLIEAGADVQAQAAASFGIRPIHVAARHPTGNVVVMSLLIEAGVEVNAGDSNGVTALHMSVRDRNLPAVELLLANGAGPNAEDRGRGSTPLRRAVANTGRGGVVGKGEQAGGGTHHRPALILWS